ncbi:MAG: ABC transporter ATP-binding protein [Firmicutes bacterium]|nr:ABC transporter ATP-binding protein [Bacillota bacterium]
MAQVRLEGITKRYGETTAVADLDLTIPDREFVTLLGPSGCGKTTTLRMIAGFVEPTGGRIFLDDDCLASPRDGIFIPPERRRMGMVFQSYAVWPHMNVFANVAYPLKVQKRPRNEIRQRVEEILSLVQLDHLADRYPNQLSGGQQQRVALARALVMRPRVLLLDEPLSNLDAQLRESMRFEIKELQRRMQVTIIYVTHDQAEAMAMSDRIVVMNRGRVEQVGPAEEIYERPASEFVARFVGLANFLQGTVIAREGSEAVLDVLDGRARIGAECPPDLAPGKLVKVLVRPEHVRIAGRISSAEQPEGGFAAVLVRRTYLGNRMDYVVEVGNKRLRIEGEPMGDLAPGDRIALIIERAYVIGPITR